MQTVQHGVTAVVVRPMRPDDVDAADRVMRLAFGTQFGMPDPLQAFGDAECIRTRFATADVGAFVAEVDGEVVGSNVATRWGSFGFFGPLTVRPDLWNGGIARQLMAPVVDLFDTWGVRQAGLCTFAESTKHVGLYQRFGFWPKYLTALMGKRVAAVMVGSPPARFSETASGEREAVLAACRAVTDAIYEGLDVTSEIVAVDEQHLGDTVLLGGKGGLDGFAVCHAGTGEAGSGTCFVKFGAVLAGPGAAERFARLLAACEALAAGRGLGLVQAGVSTGRGGAYRAMLAAGYRAGFQGIRMLRSEGPGYCRPDDWVIDDLR